MATAGEAVCSSLPEAGSASPGDMPVPWPVQRQGWLGEERQASGGSSCPAWGSSVCYRVALPSSLSPLWLLIFSLFETALNSDAQLVLWLHTENPLVLPSPTIHCQRNPGTHAPQSYPEKLWKLFPEPGRETDSHSSHFD